MSVGKEIMSKFDNSEWFAPLSKLKGKTWWKSLLLGKKLTEIKSGIDMLYNYDQNIIIS